MNFQVGNLANLFLFTEVISFVLLTGKLLVGIFYTKNILLPTELAHRTLWGLMKLTNSYSPCVRSSQGTDSLEIL